VGLGGIRPVSAQQGGRAGPVSAQRRSLCPAALLPQSAPTKEDDPDSAQSGVGDPLPSGGVTPYNPGRGGAWGAASLPNVAVERRRGREAKAEGS